ncbi:GIN domain-containing protein [Pelagovum pacificum]|uniref:Putative auto-transporter adhesin head GIN domain-containing protein n=1 Tax=Pelagovum pacificum TaxID=2588711 RepID=A0A5C5GDY9_9RHOB|nr:DUF2807 domain-containing protein [Pelagovum pacificum]QQA44491.1 DUF2807 domain-containing protein [Pelagovum pacificum]TNY32394.1 hypothetical protein FHY64_03620 [Pelagovum pacificum]
MFHNATMPSGGAGCAPETWVYDEEDFTRVDIDCGLVVRLVPGPFNITAEGAGRRLRDLQIVRQDDTLVVRRTFRGIAGSVGAKLTGNPVVRVTIAMPVLEAVEARRGCSVSSAVPAAWTLAAHAGAGSRLDLGRVRTERVDLTATAGGRITGEVRADRVLTRSDLAGTVDVSGLATQLQIEASLGGVVKADELDVSRVELRASSGAALSVTARDRISGQATSGARIIASGPAHPEVRLASGARIVPRT